MSGPRRNPIRRLLAGALLAVAATTPCTALELEDYPELRAFIEEVAERHAFPVRELERLFAGVELKPAVVRAIERPREALPWYEYRQSFLTELHLRRGLEYWTRHEAVLKRAREEHGVPPEIIVAIIGVETHYGRNKGDFRAIDALTTMVLDYPPRAEFFRRELEELLLLSRDLGVDPRSLRGSYAGAIGIGQFIPSSYRRYAVDFDGDGHRDLVSNHADAIGSVANFLRVHGWSAFDPVIDEVRLEGTYYVWVEKLGVKPALTLRELVGYGIFAQRHGNTDRRAALVELEGDDGPLYRLGYQNFYVITRYNRSKRYAMAVYELSENLRKAREAEERAP